MKGAGGPNLALDRSSPKLLRRHVDRLHHDPSLTPECLGRPACVSASLENASVGQSDNPGFPKVELLCQNIGRCRMKTLVLVL